MRDRERYVARAQLLRENGGLAVELNRRPLASRTHYFDVAPADAVVPSGAEGLHASFFGGETGGVAFEAACFPVAVFDFALGEDAMQEAFSKAFNRFADTIDFRYVHSRADNHEHYCQWGIQNC